MYLNDLQRSDFYAAIGLDARDYDKHVIDKTNDTAGRVFPLVLDVNHPDFYGCLETCVENNANLRSIDASSQPQVVKLVRKLPLFLSNAVQFLRLYLIKPIPTTQLEGTIR